jgi:hypothetical protein
MRKESLLRGIAHPRFRAAGMAAGLVRITLIQARAINAFVTSGNRMFAQEARTGGGRPGRWRLRSAVPRGLAGVTGPPQGLRIALQRDTLPRKQRAPDTAMRRRYPK